MSTIPSILPSLKTQNIGGFVLYEENEFRRSPTPQRRKQYFYEYWRWIYIFPELHRTIEYLWSTFWHLTSHYDLIAYNKDTIAVDESVTVKSQNEKLRYRHPGQSKNSLLSVDFQSLVMELSVKSPNSY